MSIIDRWNDWRIRRIADNSYKLAHKYAEGLRGFAEQLENEVMPPGWQDNLFGVSVEWNIKAEPTDEELTEMKNHIDDIIHELEQGLKDKRGMNNEYMRRYIDQFLDISLTDTYNKELQAKCDRVWELAGEIYAMTGLRLY